MKHNLLTAIIMALYLVPITSFAQYELYYDFSAVNDDGVTLYYKLYYKDEVECVVTNLNKTGYSGHVSIPSSVEGHIVTKIGKYAFHNCKGLLSVEIPNTIRGIDEYAFRGCENLESVTIPNSVTWIGEYAFLDCYSLASVVLPHSSLSIYDHAFESCNLTSVTIPKEVSLIVNNPFPGLTHVNVEAGNPFYNSANNCNAIIDSRTNTLVVGSSSTIIPETVQTIGIGAFYWCTMPTINIPNSVRIIGDRAFYGSGIESITFPNSVRSIGEEAFMYCRLKTFAFPENLTVIKKGVLSDCYSLESVTMGEYVSDIEDYAFLANLNLKSISIPGSVKNIGAQAFYDCHSLAEVYSEITDVFPIDNSVFFIYKGGILDFSNPPTRNLIMHVPYGLADIYKSTQGWNYFTQYVEMEPVPQIKPFNFSCDKKGSVTINGTQNITGKIDMADINEGADNTFTFAPKPGCKLDQVILNGLDITANVEGNTLTCTIPANSQMIVTFSSEQGDMNNDGTLDISDVVAIVNKILGN